MLPNRVNQVLYLFTGGLFALALAPFYFWPIGLVSLAGLVFAVNNATSAKHLFTNVWIFSFGQFLVGVSWVYVSISTFGNTHPMIAGTLVLLFAAGLALIPATVFWLDRKSTRLNSSHVRISYA